MQSVSSRIWTRVTVSIFYDDNDYTTGTTVFVVVVVVAVVVVVVVSAEAVVAIVLLVLVLWGQEREKWPNFLQRQQSGFQPSTIIVIVVSRYEMICGIELNPPLFSIIIN